MSILKFEMKKLFKQKKFYVLLAIILLVSIGLFMQNMEELDGLADRAREDIRPLKEETDALGSEMRERLRADLLSPLEEEQYEHLNAMSTDFFQWNSAIFNEEWEEIPKIEASFLENLAKYEEKGGEFVLLQGLEREAAILKNDWMLRHDIAYEDETYPTSPHLLLKENLVILLGLLGLALMFLLFGNILSSEKENNTILFLKTQPLAEHKWYIWKFVSLLVSMLIYIAMLVVIAVLPALLFGDYSLNLLYPQVVQSADEVMVLSTLHFAARAIFLFTTAMILIYSLALFISKWVKSSFLAIVFSSFILIIGFVLTNIIEALQVVYNPFAILRLGQILQSVPQAGEWLYGVSVLIFSLLLLGLVLLFPNKEIDFLSSANNLKPFRWGDVSRWRRPFFDIVLFEWRKLRRRGLFVQVSLILLLLMVFATAIFLHHSKLNKEYVLDVIRESIPQKERHLEFLRNLKDDYINREDIDEENRRELIEQNAALVEYFERDLILTENVILAVEAGKWDDYYEYRLRSRELASGEVLDNVLRADLSSLTIEAGIDEMKWLLEEDVKPIFSLGFLGTVYDPAIKDEREVLPRVDSSGYYTLYYYFKKYLYLLPILLLLFLVGLGFSEERGKKETLSFLRSEPLSWRSLYNGKLAHAALVSLFASLAFISLVLFIGLIFDRLGDFYYPILNYDSKLVVEGENYAGSRPFAMDVGYHFVPLGKMLLRMVALFICVILFLITLSQTLSIWLKGRLTLMVTTLLAIGLGFFISTEKLPDQAHLLPFTYFDIKRVTNGEFELLFNNPSIHTMTGMIVLLSASVLLVLIGNLSLRRS